MVQEHAEPQAHEHDRLERFNLDLMRSMGELGLLGLTVDEAYGGANLDAVAVHRARGTLGLGPWLCAGLPAHSMLFVNNLAFNGDDAPRSASCPRFARVSIGAMAMSEPDAGTDVLGLSTNAVKQGDGTRLLNGRKMYITNGVLDEEGTPADVVWVYARTGEDDRVA